MSGSDRQDRVWDVAVIGAGMAGMAASLFAAGRGLSCIQIGNGGGILFASGLLDLLGVHPVASRRVWPSPWEGLRSLAADRPDHPLARIGEASVRAALDAFVAALGDAGLPYAPLGEENRTVLTSIGTAKPTYGVPRSMHAGVDALRERAPCLLVDFRGLREFGARQIVATVGSAWPGLRSVRVEFPGFEAVPELYAAHLARVLEEAGPRERTIGLVKPLLGDARAVGFPAVLGLGRSGRVHAAFEAALGLPVFEVPTMPTSVPGLRLKAALEGAVASRGVERRLRAAVGSVTFGGECEGGGPAPGTASLQLGGPSGGERVVARAVVLATGRFAGRGLVAGRDRIREGILGLPVEQPASRESWHRREFLDAQGHEVNRAGLLADEAFRPLDATGKPRWPGLFAVGSILAHQDWMREKCGSGLAIATAWAAADNAARHVRGGGGAA